LTTGRYVLGFAILTVTVTSVAWSGVQVRRFAFPTWTGAIARLAEVVVAISEVVAVTEALGAIGLFRRVAVLATTLAFAAAIGMSARRRIPRRLAPSRNSADRAREPSSADRAVLAIACAVVAVVVCQWGAVTVHALRQGMGLDSNWYHMPFAAQAVQHGWLTRPHFTAGEPTTTYMPFTSELFHGLGMLAFGRDNLSPLLNLMWLGAVLLAAWCVGAARNAGALSLLGVAILLATPLMTVTQPGDAASDTAALFFLLAAVAFLVSAPLDNRALALSGAAAGLACGTKLSLAAPVVALTLGVFLFARRHRGPVAVAWMLPLIVAGGYWYVRNLAITGNPLPWLRLGVGGVGLPSLNLPIAHAMGFAVAHYLGERRVVTRVFLPGMVDAFGPLWIILLSISVLGVAGVAWRGRRRVERMLAVVSIASAGAYLITPGGALGPPGRPFLFLYCLRYLTPALGVALALLPMSPWLGRRQVRYGAVLALLGCFVGIEATSGPISAWPVEHAAIARAVAAALAILTVGGAVVATRPAERIWPVRRVAAAALGALAVAGVIGGWAQETWARGRYKRASPVYAWAKAIRDSRIALAGSYVGYPLYGADLSNRVEFVGIRMTRGNFRPTTSCWEWRRALLAGAYRYVVVVSPSPVTAAPELAWTKADPSAHVIAGAGMSTAFRLDGRMHPEAC